MSASFPNGLRPLVLLLALCATVAAASEFPLGEDAVGAVASVSPDGEDTAAAEASESPDGEDTADTSRCNLADALERHPPLLNAYLENDLFAGQDQGYSNGFRLSVVSPNVPDLRDTECLPRTALELNQLLDLLLPEPGPVANRGERTELNMVLTFGHQIYTPSNSTASELVVDDRPYAGWLYLGIGYNARRGDRLHSTQFNLGVIGPAALAETAQDFVHHLRGIPRFAGWHNELGPEVGLQLVHERKRRYRPASRRLAEAPWEWDAITHWGGSLGNVATYLNAGVELRFGWRLPDDFGTSALRPGGENSAPVRTGARRFDGYGAHLFLSLDGRAVARDIFLDGNSFRDSHSVDKKHFVGDAALGLAFRIGEIKIAYARYFRSREFEGQPDRPGYGAITVSGTFW